MDLTHEQRTEVEALLDELQSPEIQGCLRAGFEMDFANSILAQWEEKGWLSTKAGGQIDTLRDLIARYRRRGLSSRRYDGFGR